MQCIKCQENIPSVSAYCHKCGWKQSKAITTRAPKKRGNGQGSVYKLPNGKYKACVTLVCVTDKDTGKLFKRVTSRTFVRKVDAVNYISTLREEKKAHTITLKELNDKFLDTRKYDGLSKSQQDKLGYAWRRLEDIQYTSITDLTLEQMQRVIDKKVSTYYPAKDMKTMLSHLHILAIKHGYIDRNPTEYIELPDNEAGKKDAWTAEEVELFKTDYAAGHEFTGYILIMIYAGLRYGELAISRDKIFIDQHYMIGGIKSEAGTDRVVAIADTILPIVANLYHKNKHKLLEMNQDTFYERYWDTIERLQLRKLTPHCCRHTYFTRLASAGVQPGVITTAGGHKSYQTTLGYTHIPIQDLIDAVNKI